MQLQDMQLAAAHRLCGEIGGADRQNFRPHVIRFPGADRCCCAVIAHGVGRLPDRRDAGRAPAAGRVFARSGQQDVALMSGI